MRTDKNTPAYITVSFEGSIPKTKDKKTLEAFLSGKFNEIAGVLTKNEANLDIPKGSSIAHGAVPPKNLEALKKELAPYKFRVQEKLHQ